MRKIVVIVKWEKIIGEGYMGGLGVKRVRNFFIRVIYLVSIGVVV